jgi:RHS repeat-associated protein
LGLGAVVKRAHSQPGVDLSYIKLFTESVGDAGDQYTGLDRFGRVVDQRWINGSGTDVDRYQYGYDRDGNRLYKDNKVLSSLSEVYTYDSLNQIASYKLGTLNSGKTDVTGSPLNSQSWDYDAVGNWDSITTNSTTQTRSANKQNEITTVSGATTPTYDSNGNLTTDETNYRFVYDAWNRVVQVKNSSNVVIVTYGRDALHRHVTDTVASTVTDRFFSGDWQLLETKVGSNTVTRNVWSPVYVDTLVLRDRDTDGNGSLDERLYSLQDVNWNTTALVSAGGTVQERYTYTPFGQVTFRDGSGSTLSGSAKDWVFLHQGGERIAAGDYEFRNRVYSPSLGRWLSNDPLGFKSGDANHFYYLSNNPNTHIDPIGLCSTESINMALKLVKEYSAAIASLPFVFPLHPNNPHQHCVWNCRMTRIIGPIFAAQQSLQKEKIDDAFADLRDSLVADGCFCCLPKSARDWIEDSADSAWQPSDFIDNAAGIIFGLMISDLYTWDDTFCEKACTSIGIGPNTPEGEEPGSQRPFGPKSKPHTKCLGT